MEELINALLYDEHGISERAYCALVEHLEDVALEASVDGGKARELLIRVREASATDGRFYFDWDEA